MNNKTEFSLIELMIVVAIIGILAAIAIPVIGGGNVRAGLVQNGFICEQGVKWSVSQGFKSQFLGPDGLPATCSPEQEGNAI